MTIPVQSIRTERIVPTLSINIRKRREGFNISTLATIDENKTLDNLPTPNLAFNSMNTETKEDSKIVKDNESGCSHKCKEINETDSEMRLKSKPFKSTSVQSTFNKRTPLALIEEEQEEEEEEEEESKVGEGDFQSITRNSDKKVEVTTAPSNYTTYNDAAKTSTIRDGINTSLRGNNLPFKKKTVKWKHTGRKSVDLNGHSSDISSQNILLNEKILNEDGEGMKKKLFKSIPPDQHERGISPDKVTPFKVKSRLLRTDEHQKKLQGQQIKLLKPSRRSILKSYDDFYNAHDFMDTTARFVSRDMKADITTIVL